jgi:two-component sensor histidine kinase/ligand-binding sensor domain-containing protein
MSVNKVLIWTIISLLFSVILRGQTIPYTLFTTHDGLPQSQVQCLFQDSRGYIWAGTGDGLAYFNGVKFTSILAKDGLPYPVIQKIQEDKKGNIIFNCGKYLCTYDGKTLTSDTSNIRFKENIFCIDNEGIGWSVNNEDKQLYYSKDYKKWLLASDEYPDLRNKKWYYLAFDAKFNRLNLSTESNEFYTFDKKELSKIHPSTQVNFINFLTNAFQSFATIKDSIFEVQPRGLKFLHKTNSGEIFNVTQRENGTIHYLLGQSNTIYSIDKSRRKDSVVLKEFVNFLFIDRDKNTWASSEQGLIRLFYDGFKNFDQKYLSCIWSMVEDKTGGMWFGSLFKPTEIRYWKDGKMTTKRAIDQPSPPNKYDAKQFGQFYFGGGRDLKGNLYFPMNWGIMKYDGKAFSAFDKATNADPISMNFLTDNDRNCLVSASRGGINIVDLATGATKYYGEAKGLHRTGYVLGATKDKKNNYWLATPNGLARFDISRDSIVKTYTQERKNFSFNGTVAILADAKGTIWAGSEVGLLRYDEQKDSFMLLPTDVLQRTIYSLANYKDQYLVIGASDGVYFLDLKAFYTEGSPEKSAKSKIIVRCFNQFNGYLGIEPNQNCLYIDSKDNVWVAASDIVTKITPSELNMLPQPLTPYITTINNVRISYADYGQTILLNRGINTAKIFFEAVGFERPFSTEFRFKLNNQDWSEWRTEDFAVLDNLSSGTYPFSVQTRPAGTVYENEIKSTSIRFKIDISILKEPYFPFLGFMILVSGVIAFFYHRNERNQRESEAKQRHDIDIEQRKNAELLNADRTHRVKNNLNIMQGAVTLQSTRAKGEEAKQALQKVVDRIQSMAQLHNHLVAQKGVSSLKMSGYLEDLCDAVKKSYTDDSQNLTYQLNVGTVELPEKMGRDIGSVVCELVTNSIKHAFNDQENPQVTVHLAETPTSVLLVYQDNGCGIPTDFDWQKIDSLGMTIIHSIAENFNGKVKLENRQGLSCQVSFEKKVNL